MPLMQWSEWKSKWRIYFCPNTSGFVCFFQSNTKTHLTGLTTVIFLKAAIKGERQCSRRCVTVVSLEDQLFSVIMKLWLVNNEGIAFRFEESEAVKWQILRSWKLFPALSQVESIQVTHQMDNQRSYSWKGSSCAGFWICQIENPHDLLLTVLI